MTLLMFTELDFNMIIHVYVHIYSCVYHIYNMPFNFITLWKSEMKLNNLLIIKQHIYNILSHLLHLLTTGDYREFAVKYCVWL